MMSSASMASISSWGRASSWREPWAQVQGLAKEEMSSAGHSTVDQVAKEARHQGENMAESVPAPANLSQHEDHRIGFLQPRAVGAQYEDAVGNGDVLA